MMDSFEKTLQGQMTELAQSADPAGAQRVLRHLPDGAASTVTTRRRGRTPRTLLMVTAGAVTAAAAVLALNAAGVIGTAPNATRTVASHDATASAGARSLAAHRAGSANMAPLWAVGQPCPSAEPATLAQLAASTKIPIWIPDNDTTRVTDSWSCSGAPVVMIGNVQISYEPGWSDVNIPAKWRDLAEDYGGYTATISGHLALIQPATAPADSIFYLDGIGGTKVPVSTNGGTRNQIMIVDHGTLIRFLSKSDVPMSQLLDDARALDFSQPVSAH